MKRQKKYTSRDQIISDIDKSTVKMNKLIQQAIAFDEAAELFRVSENEVEFKRNSECADKLFAKAKRIENTRLKRLGKALAMFDTAPFPVSGPDSQQVTLQNA